jgi:hypothetical protein
MILDRLVLGEVFFSQCFSFSFPLIIPPRFFTCPSLRAGIVGTLEAAGHVTAAPH